MKRGSIVWADLGAGFGRRPVCVISRTPALFILTSVVCAPVTRTIRGIRSEVRLGPEEGVSEECVINCDSIVTIPLSNLIGEPIGSLSPLGERQLNRALRYALAIS